MNVNKVLWPTDFSKSAAKALPTVHSLAHKYDAEVHVMYVVEDLSYYHTWLGGDAPHQVDKLTHFSKELAEQKLDELCNSALGECRLVVKHIAMGDSAREILKFIASEGVDMVIMATRGSRGDFPFGSITEKVVKHSPVPVVSVPMAGE